MNRLCGFAFKEADVNLYRIKGTVNIVENCECEYCQGHLESYKFKREVEANDEAEAKQKVREGIAVRGRTIDDWCDWSWMIELVREISEAEQMRRIGAPQLPTFIVSE